MDGEKWAEWSTTLGPGAFVWFEREKKGRKEEWREKSEEGGVSRREIE